MIGIIDYGMSNLYSVKNACDYLGLDSVVSKDVSILSKCDKLILPGVGAFQDCMHTLHSMGLYDFIVQQVIILRQYLKKIRMCIMSIPIMPKIWMIKT